MRGIPANGEAIREARKAHGLTQDQLATQAGCTVRTVRNAEHGLRLDANTLRVLAEVLKVSLSDISLATVRRDQMLQNKKVVLEWRDAMIAGEVGNLLKLHHADSVQVMPGAEAIPGGGNFTGTDEIEKHYRESMQAFRLEKVADERLDAVENTVFYRFSGTIRSVATGRTTETAFFNEFELEHAKIRKRICISDISGLREILTEV